MEPRGGLHTLAGHKNCIWEKLAGPPTILKLNNYHSVYFMQKRCQELNIPSNGKTMIAYGAQTPISATEMFLL